MAQDHGGCIARPLVGVKDFGAVDVGGVPGELLAVEEGRTRTTSHTVASRSSGCGDYVKRRKPGGVPTTSRTVDPLLHVQISTLCRVYSCVCGGHQEAAYEYQRLP